MGQHNYLQLKTHMIISVLLIAWSYINVSWFSTFFYITCMEIGSSTYGVSVELVDGFLISQGLFLLLLIAHFPLGGRIPPAPPAIREKRVQTQLQFICRICMLEILQLLCCIFIKNWIHNAKTTASISKGVARLLCILVSLIFCLATVASATQPHSGWKPAVMLKSWNSGYTAQSQIAVSRLGTWTLSQHAVGIDKDALESLRTMKCKDIYLGENSFEIHVAFSQHASSRNLWKTLVYVDFKGKLHPN